jgi:ATP-dependent DNA helicase RecQ
MDALAEQVVDAATGLGHVILYCLTVRQVDQLHAHLRDYTAGRQLMLRKFHGRLSELEKASVSNEFNEAPHRGEDGYAPMVVVATSAFGLGVSRKDIRTVFCVSPPTDLAALYQQLGRGGRDMATRNVTALTETTYALALATSKTLDTAEWLASQDLPAALLTEFGERVLCEATRGTLDLVAVRDALINAHLVGNRLSPAQVRDTRLRDAWKVGLTRAVAALADLDAVVDLGDVPVRVAVTAGTRSPNSLLASAVRAAVMALPARGTAASRTSISLAALHAYLAADASCIASGYRPRANLAELWLLLCDMHDTAALDVSQRPNTHMLIGLQAQATRLPDGYLARVSGKLARAATEARLLRDFFASGHTCLNERLARYFSVTTAPGCCSTDQVRCSVCSVGPAGSGVGIEGPASALLLGRLRPAATDPAVRARRVDEAVVRMLRQHFNGATAREIRLVLRGEDRIWVPALSRYRRLPTKLTDNSQFGQLPKITDTEVNSSLARLAAAGSVVCQEAGHWRTASNAVVGPRRVPPRRASTGGTASGATSGGTAADGAQP